MKDKINWKSIVVALLIILIGVVLILSDYFKIKSQAYVWISIGCSLIASGLVILFTAILIERKEYDPISEWKIDKIATTRAEINGDCASELKRARYMVDIVAFGLQSFRNKQTRAIEDYLKKGVNFRILTMNPESVYVHAREQEEDNTNIKNSIEKLVEWANRFNQKNYKGKIVVKGYSCMTLDFYWRVDNVVFVGPYWYGYDSQQTITYKYSEGGSGFELYTDYFEQLWGKKELSVPLTEITDVKLKKRPK